MIEVTMHGSEGVQRHLRGLQTKLEGGMERVSPRTLEQIDEIVREHDAEVFLHRSLHEWRKLSLPAAIWSRVQRAPSGLKTIAQALEAASSELNPLIDTGRLFQSIATRNADHIAIVAGTTTFIIGTSVEYAAKHFSGDWQVFDFGPEEEARHAERFEKPLDGKDRQRDYYRLETWAKKHYPATIWVPERSWFEPLPLTDRERIAQLLGDDELNLL